MSKLRGLHGQSEASPRFFDETLNLYCRPADLYLVGLPTTEKHEVAHRTRWQAILGEAAVETLSMMAGIVVTISPDPLVTFQGDVTGTVGIAGVLSAVFSLRCSLRAAVNIASHMLAVSPEDAAAQHGDAVAEICNIIAGHFKVKIGLGDKCMLSVPTVITGRDYQVRLSAGGERLEVQLLDGEERIAIALDIRK